MPLLSKLGCVVIVLGALAPIANLSAQGLTYVLCAPGDSTPSGDDTIDFPGSFAEGNSGIGYQAHLKGADVGAIFTQSGLGRAEVLRVGAPAPGGGTILAFAGNIYVNNNSQVVTFGGVMDANNVSHSAILVGSSYLDLRIAVEGGQTRPDGSGEFTYVTPESINDLGDVDFQGNGGGMSGVFVAHHDGTLSTIAVNGQNAPGETYPFSSVVGYSINNSGRVLLAAGIHDAQWGTGNDDGIYSASSANDIVKIARSYEQAPGTSYFLGSMVPTGMNNSGQAVIYGDLIDSQGTSHGDAIFAGASSATLKTIAFDGQVAPGNLGHFTSFENTLGINNSGQVAFVGYMDGAVSSGVFLGDGTTQRIIVRTGQVAPGGGTFTGFTLPHANNTGTILFGAYLNGNNTPSGLFLSDGTDVIKVAEAGDVVNGTTISNVGFDPKAFNDFRQVVYQDNYVSGYDPTSGLPENNSQIILFAPSLNWRSVDGGTWDNSANWTASLPPSTYSDVTISPTDGGVVSGPSSDTAVASLTVSGPASNGASGNAVGGFVKADAGSTTSSTLVVTGVNSASGNVTLTDGALTVESGGAVDVQTGGTLVVSGNTTIQQGGGIDVLAGGTLALNGTVNVASGGTLVLNSGGSLVTNSGFNLVLTNGTFLNQGSLSPSGAIQKINITGTYTQASTGALSMNIAGIGSANYSQLLVTGSANLAGALQVRLTSNFISQMSMNDAYTLVSTTGTLSGTFSNVPNGGRIKTSDGSGSFQVNYTQNSVVLSNYVALTSQISMSGNNLTVTFPSVNGRGYSLQSSTDLSNWTTIQTGITGDGTSKVLTVPNGAQGRQIYYRVSTTTP